MTDLDEKMNELLGSLATGPEIEIEGQFVPAGYVVVVDGERREVAEFVLERSNPPFAEPQEFFLRSFDGEGNAIHWDVRVNVEQWPERLGDEARFVSAT